MQGLSRASKKRKNKSLRNQLSDNFNDIKKSRANYSSDSSILESFSETTTISGGEGPSCVTLEDFSTGHDVPPLRHHDLNRLCLSDIVYPTSIFTFYKEHFGKKPLVVNRVPYDARTILKNLPFPRSFLSTSSTQLLSHKEDIILSKFEIRESSANCAVIFDSKSGHVKYSDIIQALKSKYCAKLLAQHRFDNQLWSCVSQLEQELGVALKAQSVTCPIRTISNYAQLLTNTFIIQLGGKSLCRFGKPLQGSALPRPQSVDDFELNLDKTIDSMTEGGLTEVTLGAGDTLFLPRGWVWSCCGIEDTKGKSKTISSKNEFDAEIDEMSFQLQIFEYRRCTYADLLETLLPTAIASFVNDSLEARRSLPIDLYSFCGAAHSEKDETDERRRKFQSTLRCHLDGVVTAAVDLLDAAVDQMAKQFIVERLPVPLTQEEEALTGAGNSERGDISIGPYTYLKMLRPGLARAVVEDGMVVVYHCMDNSRTMFEAEVKPVEFELDDGPAIEALLSAYPTPVMVADLPHPSQEDEDKIEIARSLWKEGFLVIADIISKQSGDGAGETGDDPPDDISDDPF